MPVPPVPKPGSALPHSTIAERTKENMKFAGLVSARLEKYQLDTTLSTINGMSYFVKASLQANDIIHGNINGLWSDEFEDVGEAADFILYDRLMKLGRKEDAEAVLKKLAGGVERPLSDLRDYPCMQDINSIQIDALALIGKPTVIYHWESSCEACSTYFEIMGRFSKRYGEEVNFIFVSSAQVSDPEVVKRRSDDNSYGRFILPMEEPAKIIRTGIGKVPVIVVYDREGKIVLQDDFDNEKAVMKAIESSLLEDVSEIARPAPRCHL